MPAGIDERTGYWSYAFEQVERAMMSTPLRTPGMGVKVVRQALDQHSAARDEAMQAAGVADLPAMTVVGRVVSGTPLGRIAQEWDEADLVESVQAAGGTCLGRPWRASALETPVSGLAGGGR